MLPNGRPAQLEHQASGDTLMSSVFFTKSPFGIIWGEILTSKNEEKNGPFLQRKTWFFAFLSTTYKVGKEDH